MILVSIAGLLLATSFPLASADDFYNEHKLYQEASSKASHEFIRLNPFWTNTMIPVAVCLAVALLIVSIFAVSLIAVRSLQDTEPEFATFAPPGFDAVWERNFQAELGLQQKGQMQEQQSQYSTRESLNSPIETNTVYPSNPSNSNKATRAGNLEMPLPIVPHANTPVMSNNASSGRLENFNQPNSASAAKPAGLFSFGANSSPSGAVPTSGLASSFSAPSAGGLFGTSTLPSTTQAPASSFSFNNNAQNQAFNSAPLLSTQTSTGMTYPRETNFMDLPAELRQSIEALERTIQSHADASRPFSTRVEPTSQLTLIDDKLNLLAERISAYSTLHVQQNSRINCLKKATSSHWRYSESVGRTIEASRRTVNDSSSTGGSSPAWSRAFAPNDATSGHFDDLLNEMNQQLEIAEAMAEAIRKQIEPIITSSSVNSHYSPAESVILIMKNEREITVSLQRRYNQLRDEVDSLRKNFRSFCVKYRRDNRDPFASKAEPSATTPMGSGGSITSSNSASASSQLPAPPKPSLSAPIQQQQPTAFGGLTPSLPNSTTGLNPRPASLFNFGYK